MTSKKRRQRGSRTHGGGTHKNRRGAGHRGGRGRAGRDKHEYHNYEPRGKSGFKRPQKTDESVATINLKELDEDLALLTADGVAIEEDDRYRVDVRDIVDTGDNVDRVKVLAGGSLRTELTIIADSFSDNAIAAIEEAGGEAIITSTDETTEPEAEQAEGDTTDEDIEDN